MGLRLRMRLRSGGFQLLTGEQTEQGHMVVPNPAVRPGWAVSVSPPPHECDHWQSGSAAEGTWRGLCIFRLRIPLTVASPDAMALKIRARWETDLSPGIRPGR